MSNRLYKWERKYGKYAISNLTVYLLVGWAIGYAVEIINADFLEYLTLDPYAILHGQIWRLFTWLIMPPSNINFIFLIFMFLLYYSLGTALEQYWGKFFYNVYIFSGMLFTMICAFIAYFVLLFPKMRLDDPEIGNLLSQYAGMIVGSMFSTYYILSTIFFAYAALAPNQQLYLYMILPVKIKWIAWLDAAQILYHFIIVGRLEGPQVLAYRICIIMSLLNFIIYFLATRKLYRFNPKHVKQKVKFNQSMRQAQPAAGQPIHKCTVCGRTELDDENLTFRYCSKCNGNHEYCQDHLFTHEHIH